MSSTRTILSSWPSLYQKLSKLVEIRRSSDENKFCLFFETLCATSLQQIYKESKAIRGRPIQIIHTPISCTNPQQSQSHNKNPQQIGGLYTTRKLHILYKSTANQTNGVWRLNSHNFSSMCCQQWLRLFRDLWSSSDLVCSFENQFSLFAVGAKDLTVEGKCNRGISSNAKKLPRSTPKFA